MTSTAVLPAWLRDAAGRRRPEVLALVALFLGAAAILALAVAFPMSEKAPIELSTACIGVALAMAIGTLVAGDRLPRAALLAQVGVAVVCNTAIVAASATTAGGMADGLAYVWLAVYVAVFFPEIAGRFAAVAVAAYGGGLLIADLPRMLTGWAILSGSTLMLAVVLGRVSIAVRGRVATDSLTGALNRDGLADAAAHVFGRARRRSDEVTIAVLDLDHFKEVNDREGHAGGDRLLREAVAAWREVLRGDDVLARLGGDEFVLVLPRTTSEDAGALLDRLQRAHAVRWSFGVTQWRPDEPLAAALERADALLYAHKAESRRRTA